MLTDEMIENGAAALREHQMAGRYTNEWFNLPKNQRKKWLETSEIVLRAALQTPE